MTFSVKSRPFKSQILTTYDLFCHNEGAVQKNSSTFCFQFVPGFEGGGAAVPYNFGLNRAPEQVMVFTVLSLE